jgi:hypothetical protein
LFLVFLFHFYFQVKEKIYCFHLNFNNISLFNQYIFFTGYTTAEILAFTVDAGTQAFCSTINQFVFYQVSPITGLVLGWYNSTGSIKL